MKRIPAIPTKYNGVTYRSRLEARWAVFFDLCEESFIYEHEGFNLGAPLGWYLPDFYLPSLDMYIEIKGPAPTDIELAKVEKLCESESVVLFSGTPHAYHSTGISFAHGCTNFGGGKYKLAVNWMGSTPEGGLCPYASNEDTSLLYGVTALLTTNLTKTTPLLTVETIRSWKRLHNMDAPAMFSLLSHCEGARDYRF